MEWLPGIDPMEATRLFDSVRMDPLSIREEPVQATLAHLNLIATAIRTIDGTSRPQGLAALVRDLASLAEELDARTLFQEINADRAVSGFAPLSAPDVLEPELALRRRYFADTIRGALDTLPSATLVEAMTDIAQGTTATGERPPPASSRSSSIATRPRRRRASCPARRGTSTAWSTRPGTRRPPGRLTSIRHCGRSRSSSGTGTGSPGRSSSSPPRAGSTTGRAGRSRTTCASSASICSTSTACSRRPFASWSSCGASSPPFLPSRNAPAATGSRSRSSPANGARRRPAEPSPDAGSRPPRLSITYAPPLTRGAIHVLS